MILLVDIGNTRIKWALSRDGSLDQQRAAAHATWTRADALAAFESIAPPARVLVSNVGGEPIAALIRDTARELWSLEPEFIHSTASAAGIRNAYSEPAKLGVDRWLAMIGAYASEQRPICVVSIGTAATIDGVDATGRHLGGLIIPGPDLMVDSLLHNTSDIARRTQNGSIGTGVFANNTLGAIKQGAAHAAAALIERAVATMREQLGESPTLVISGGASSEVASALGIPHVAMSDLVLRGLAVYATHADRGED